MSLKSVNNILGVLETQAKWQEQPFQRLLKYWSEVVGAVVATHAQPLHIQRDVLHVATSSAAWAQNLTFERRRLVLKLNARLSTSLADVRFSTVGWRRPQSTPEEPQTMSCEHPSFVGDQMNVPDDVTPTNLDVKAAFQHWAKTVQARSHGLPLCPQCHCPTPAGELLRWHVCCVCATKQSAKRLSSA